MKGEQKTLQQSFQKKIDYEELVNCTRCGFCLPSCPTYIESDSDEVQSPRGRIALMKGVIDGIVEPTDEVKRSIDTCLGCRACETACPSGVKFGELLEQTRAAINEREKKSLKVKVVRNIVFNQLFTRKKRLVHLTNLVGLYQRSGLQSVTRKLGLIKFVPKNLRPMEAVLPNIPRKKELKNRPTYLKPTIEKKKRVGFFSGCLMDTVFMKTNDSTMRLLQLIGCEVVIPNTQGCCGALHAHSGENLQLKQMVQKNIEAFEEENVDYIVTNAGGCGGFLVDYGAVLKDDPEWHERAQRFTKKIKDISEVLMELGFHTFDLKLDDKIVTYQDSCHLKNSQKVFHEPRVLLQSISGVKYVEMNNADRCCGSAGTYNILEHEISMNILDDKMSEVKKTKAATIITSNPGCLLQMKIGVEREGLGDRVEVLHIADFLIKAYETNASRTTVEM